MSIADQITRLSNAKAAIKTSIENKGVTVGNDVKLDAYPALIDSIEVGGGSGETHTNPDFYDLRTQNGTNYDNLFRGYNGPDIDVSAWDTSKVTSARYCFSYCTKSMDISNWDLSSLTNAQYMFESFTNGNKYIDLSVLDFSNVSNADHMFASSNTDYLDVRNINLTGTANYSNLFASCSGTELDLSTWDISGVTNLYYLCAFSSFKKVNLSGWKTTNITDMGTLFYYMQSLETLIIPDWDMTNATSTSSFIGSVSKLKYIDLSRSNDLTIKKIASFLPKKTATTYGEVVIPADTSQDAIDALTAKYWKPIGPKLDLNSTKLVLELDEIKPGKTTKLWTGNNDPWYGDDRPETIEFILSNESVATINGREIISTGIEGTTEITARRRDTQEVISNTVTLTVSETDSKPNLIKFRTTGGESSSHTLIIVNGKSITSSIATKDTITGIYSYDAGEEITSFMLTTSYYKYVNEIVKFNFNETNITSMRQMFYGYQGKYLDLSGWDTSNVTSMEGMLNGSNLLIHLNISGCDTSNVTNMNYMLQGASNLKTITGALDLSSMPGLPSNYLFDQCPNLETLYLKNIYKNITMSNSNNYSINLGYTKVKDECLLYIINELPDLYAKGLTNTSNIILTLPPTNTLTAEQVQPAIDKGWQVANVNY